MAKLISGNQWQSKARQWQSMAIKGQAPHLRRDDRAHQWQSVTIKGGTLLTFTVGMLPSSSVFAPMTRATSSHILRDVMVDERETDVSIVMSRLTPPACAIRWRRSGHPRSSEVIRGHPRSSEVIRGHPRSSRSSAHLRDQMAPYRARLLRRLRRPSRWGIRSAVHRIGRLVA